MEIKVKEVGAAEEKSVQQVEQELLEKHQESLDSGVTPEETRVETTTETKPEPVSEEKQVQQEEIKPQSSELNEEEVLKFIGNRYGKEIKSLDELNQQREEEPLPEDVAKYLKYKKETGRGFDDFAKMQKNYDEMEPDRLLREYLSATEKGLDAEDITDLMEDYQYDEDIDDEKQIRKIKLAKKKTIAKAKDYFAKQQELYKVPLESRRDSSPEVETEEYKAYKQYIAEAKTVEERNSRAREVYLEKTNNVFSEFKGFEFTLDDNKVYFSPGDSDELLKVHSNPSTFIQQYQEEDGSLKNAEGYHRSLAMAMHPEKFAKFFYEQGKSAAADEQMKKLKNINMTTRSAPEVGSTKSGMQIKSVSTDHGRGLKIRSKKK
jgi:hypothetical protein